MKPESYTSSGGVRRHVTGSFLLMAFWCLLISGTAQAEFIKTGLFTYQETNEHTKVIVVPDIEGVSGIFIITGEAHPLQLFDIESLPAKGSYSVFLQFSPTKKRFTDMHVGAETYSIQGSLTLKLGDKPFPRISLDQSSGNPYLSIVEQNGKDDFSLLAFLGTLEVLNRSGENAILFEANALKNDAIRDYRVTSDQKLMLGDVNVNIDKVGIVSTFSNKCSELGSILIRKHTREELSKLDREALKKVALEWKKKGLSSENYIPLRSEGSDFIFFDYLNEEIVKISYIRKLNIDGKSSSICLEEPLTGAKK